MQVPDEIVTVLAGALGGAVYATSGYFDNPKDAQGLRPAFDAGKFLPTLVLGVLIGGVGAALGISYDQAAGLLATFGLPAIVAKVFKAAMTWVGG